MAAAAGLASEEEFMRQKKSAICLSSNTSKDLFPDNTQSEFANQLPRPITNREGKRFHVRLKSLAVTTETANSERVRSGVAKIIIYELESQTEGMEYRRCAVTFPFPPTEWQQAGYGFTTFRHPPHLPLRFQSLDKLHVKLVDLDNEALQLRDGPPTLLWLEITDMGPDEEFMVTCESRQTDYFPGNRLDEFTVPLPKEYLLEDFETALVNVTFPPLMRESDVVELELGKRHLAFHLNEYANEREFVEAVKAAVARSFGGDLSFGVFPDEGEMAGQAYFHHHSNSTRRPIAILPCPRFTQACGQITRPKAKTALAPGKTIVFQGKPNLHYGRPHPLAMLQCSLIHSNVQCGQESPLMQCLPLPRSSDEVRMYEPKQLTYHPVKERPFNTINFRFTDPGGEGREFVSENPDDSIIITLSFRRRY